jgi:hypothetical protein
VTDEKFCNDPRHDTPCRLPCKACEEECEEECGEDNDDLDSEQIRNARALGMHDLEDEEDKP